jgi:hypothetical protein
VGTGIVVCWGSDNNGQASPTASVDGTSGTASAVAAGGFHSLAIKTVPEPGGWLMLVAGTAFLGLLYRRRARELRIG